MSLTACKPCGDDQYGVPDPPLYGRILDSATNVPLDAAVVTANGAQCEFSSGDYTCRVVPGDYDLVVTAPGYDKQAQSTTVVASEGDGCGSGDYVPRLLDFEMHASKTFVCDCTCHCGYDASCLNLPFKCSYADQAGCPEKTCEDGCNAVCASHAECGGGSAFAPSGSCG